jgi:hypothetical protein
MLDKIGHQDYSGAIAEHGALDKLGDRSASNPYSRNDKNSFIDESRISDDAIRLYEREKDVSKFSKIVLSDEDDNSANSIFLQKVFGGDFSIDSDAALHALLDNKDFLSDVEI